MRERIFIVGGGPSINSVDLRKLGSETTIAVNKSAFFVPNPDHFITMDYTVLRKVGLQRVKSLKCAKHFVVNMAVDYIRNRNGVPTDTRYNIVYNQLIDVFDSIIICKREDGIGTNFNDFRCGDNSGLCALQLALIMGYTEIYLLGFDLRIEGTKTHFHSGYREAAKPFSERVANYIKGFSTAIKETRHKYKDVSLYSCSPISSLNHIIPYVNVGEVLK